MSLFFKRENYKNYTLPELVKASQTDDIQALDELIKREQKNIYATLYYLNSQNTELQDGVQEILFKMCKNLKQLKNPRLFKSWLNKITMHYYYDVQRKKIKQPEILPVENFANDDGKNDVWDWLLMDKKKKPDEKFLLKELDNTITNAVKKLPEQLKIAIVLREFQGLSYDEIADVTNTNIGTVKSRIARARTKLQEKLKNYIKQG